MYIVCVSVLFAVSDSATAQQLHTTLDVLRPARKSFVKNINNLLIVNNSIKQPDDFGHSLVLYGSNRGNQSIDLSGAAKSVLFAATKEFDYSGLFSSVGLVEYSLANGTFFAGNSLSHETVDSLCKQYGADALLSLDRVIIYDLQEAFLDENYNHQVVFEVFATTMWTFSFTDGTIQSLSRSDTLYWEGNSYNSSLALQQLPDRQTALMDVAEYAGEQFAKQYLPQWETVDRYLYENSNDLIQIGLTKFTHRQWNDAIDIWQQAYDDAIGKGRKSKTDYQTRAYAAANIAVAQEICDNLSAAQQWAKSSAEAFGKIDTADAAQQQVNLTFYMRELEQRLKEIVSLGTHR